jgi:aldehyde dehydrogenase (NAD+)
MRPKRVASLLTSFGCQSFYRYEARGHVLIISPWNFPFYLTLMPLVSAISAGNCVLLRPSRHTPDTSRVMKEIIAAVFDPRQAALVTGDEVDGQELAAVPFDHVFFTGSTKSGSEVMAAAAKSLASVTLELGGKCPVIVDSTTDIAAAAKRIAWGKFLNAGQSCVAVDYVVVPRDRRDELVRELVADVKRFYGETEEQRHTSPDLCRIINDSQFGRLKNLFDRSVAAGAAVALGGTSDPKDRYFSPTILTDVAFNSPMMEEEIFGPILPVIAVDNMDAALKHVCSGGTPLALYVFSRDKGFVRHALDTCQSGAACINDTVVHIVNNRLPFGGKGASGMGKFHGIFGFREFSHARAVVRRTFFDTPRLFYPPYTENVTRLVKLLVNWFS